MSKNQRGDVLVLRADKIAKELTEEGWSAEERAGISAIASFAACMTHEGTKGPMTLAALELLSTIPCIREPSGPKH